MMKKRIASMFMVALMAISFTSTSALAAADTVDIDYENFQDEYGCSTREVSEEPVNDLNEEILEPVIRQCTNENVELDIDLAYILSDDFQNEDGCSTEFVSSEADSSEYDTDKILTSISRETRPPTDFHNLATDGIYKGQFYELRGTMYTKYCFDAQDGSYFSRVRCIGECPHLSFKVGNYCVTCKKTLSTCKDTYYTPYDFPLQYSDWYSFQHTTSSAHENHLMCPFVVKTSDSTPQLYYIDGDIWVNYTDDWE